MRTKTSWLALALFGVLPSLAVAQDMPGNPPGSGDTAGSGSKGSGGNPYGSFKLPDGAKLLGEASLNEVRQLPEISSTSAKGSNIERVVGVSAWDRVYQAKGSYKKVVGFFDSQLKSQGIDPEARATTPVSTAWAVRLPEGGLTHLIVRNTVPVSFEIVQASSDTGSIRQPTGGSDTGGGMNPPGGGVNQPGGGMNQPGGEMNQPGGGMKNPSGGMNQPGGGMNQPSK